MITLVRVPNVFAAGALTLSATPPIFLAYLAASLRRNGYEVRVVDSVGEAIERVYYLGRKNLYANGLRIEEILEVIPEGSRYIGVSFPFSHEWPLAKEVCFSIKKSDSTNLR